MKARPADMRQSVTMGEEDWDRWGKSRSPRAVFLLGVALGLVLAAAAAVVLAVAVDFSPGGVLLYTEQSTDVLRASVGDCLLRNDAEHVAVACGDPVVAEVYAVAAPPIRDAARYPGRDALDMFGAGACELAFENHLHESYLTSDREYRVLIPNEDAWSAGHTDVYCLLRH